jgi:hypothetical protein
LETLFLATSVLLLLSTSSSASRYVPLAGSWCSTLARIHSPDPGETWHAARSLGLPAAAADDDADAGPEEAPDDGAGAGYSPDDWRLFKKIGKQKG